MKKLGVDLPRVNGTVPTNNPSWLSMRPDAMAFHVAQWAVLGQLKCGDTFGCFNAGWRSSFFQCGIVFRKANAEEWRVSLGNVPLLRASAGWGLEVAQLMPEVFLTRWKAVIALHVGSMGVSFHSAKAYLHRIGRVCFFCTCLGLARMNVTLRLDLALCHAVRHRYPNHSFLVARSRACFLGLGCDYVEQIDAVSWPSPSLWQRRFIRILDCAHHVCLP